MMEGTRQKRQRKKSEEKEYFILFCFCTVISISFRDEVLAEHHDFYIVSNRKNRYCFIPSLSTLKISLEFSQSDVESSSTSHFTQKFYSVEHNSFSNVRENCFSRFQYSGQLFNIFGVGNI